jgi:hypothetical protein
MRDHFGAVEADFQRYYDLDLREVLWGSRRYGARRLMSLVSGLPLEGAVARAVLYGGRDWSNADELLATLVEMTDLGNRIAFVQNTKKGTKVWEPVRVDRPTKQLPDEPAPKKEQASPAQMREAFGAENIYHDYREGD